MTAVSEALGGIGPTALRLSGAGYVSTCGRGAHSLPCLDPDVPCCDTSAWSEGERCSCWVPVYTPEPSDAEHEAPQAVRRAMCHDCAYRPGSPERAEQDDAPLPANPDRPFTCHQGMPTLRGYTHPDLDRLGLDGGWCLWGSAVGDRDDFAPVRRGTTAWKADGQPAELCAGWASVAGVR